MSTEQKGYKILLGTTTQWESSTTVPAKGQICINTDDQSIRVGNGSDFYGNLSPLTTENRIEDFTLVYDSDTSTITWLTPDGVEIQNIVLTNLQELYDTYGGKQIVGPVEVIPSGGDGVVFTVNGKALFKGDVTIQGTTTTSNTQNLQVEDNLITVAKGNAGALTAPAGLHVQHYDGTNDGALVFDNNGIAYVGDVVLDNNGNINTQQSDLQPLATRTDLADGRLIEWDSKNNTLVDSGKTVDDFVAKVTTKASVYCTNPTDGSPVTIAWDTVQSGNTIVRRDSGGHVRVTDPRERYDAVNKYYAEANFVPRKPSNFDTTITTYNTEGAYCFTYNATNKTFTPVYKEYGLSSNNLPIYNDDATLTVVTPGLNGSEYLDGNAASDTYVYNNFVLSEFGHTPSQSAQDLLTFGLTKLVYVADFDADSNVVVGLSEYPNNDTIALRTSEGQLSATEPTEWYHVANKEYVDAFQTITILGADE